MEIKRSTEQRRGMRHQTNDEASSHPSEQLLEIIAASAYDNLRAYSNCCRSTLQALQVHLQLEDSGSVQASFALAGGIGGTGETCGTVIGGLMAVGLSIGSDDPRDEASQQRARGAAKQFVERVLEQYGSTRCYELQEALVGWSCDDASKKSEWEAAGGPIACASICADVARHAAEIILSHPASTPDPT